MFDLAILVKDSALQQQQIQKEYIDPLSALGTTVEGIVAFSLEYKSVKQTATDQKAYLDKLLPEIDKLGIVDIYVCDGAYFKTLTKETKIAPHYGYVLPCAIKGYEHMNIILGANHQALFTNPDLREKIALSLNAIASHKAGNYTKLGTGIIHSCGYPNTLSSIKYALDKLHKYPMISSDIEAFSLNHYDAGIGTIGFAWDQHNGIVFSVDASNQNNQVVRVKNNEVRLLLYNFFMEYKGTVIWHNATYDLKVLVYQLFMEGLIDFKGMVTGIEVLARKIHDTKIIAYLATNSCAGNHLSLKEQSHEFAGNYAQTDINDIRLIPHDKLMEYNLVDCLATWYVFNKHMPTVIADSQLDIYNEIMLPSIEVIVHMQLTGMCLDMEKVLFAEKQLKDISIAANTTMQNSTVVKKFVDDLRDAQVIEDNLKLKNKQRLHSDPQIQKIVFNPNSGVQLQKLLYQTMGLPILSTTDKGSPSTDGKTLKKLSKIATEPSHLEFIEALRKHIGVDKILTSFIPAFKNSPKADDGYHYLYGNFNLGGTVSGRLSSSNVNLQQLPSGSTFGKLIKDCFIAPKGKLFGGADFASLEDRIDALLTKDPNKLKVYTDGYDGHSLRAYGYFGDQMPDIIDTVESINSIADKYPDLRQDSKAPTFALTYAGTYRTMMTNLGWSEVKSRGVEDNYKKMYQVSMSYKSDRITEASVDGYATVAFGLKVRTPLLQRVLLGNGVTPRAAEAEARTVGNAMGQSYGLLNNRVAIMVLRDILASPFKHDIQICALIHDAIYFRCEDRVDVIKFLNDSIGKHMSWCELPEIKHDKVGLSGEVDIFFPTWAYPCNLKNNISEQEIVNSITREITKRNQKNE